MNYRAMAVAAARRAGIDPAIFLRQISQESGFNPRARSGAGAEGIAQFMPATAAAMHVNPWNPRSALDGAARMDAANLAKYHDWRDVLSIYNSGRGWATGQKIGQTNNYVRSILGGKTPKVGAATPLGGGAGSASLVPGGSSPNELALLMLQQAGETAAGQAPDFSGIMQLALQRQQLGAAQQQFGPTPGQVPMPSKGGAVPALKGEDPTFLRKLNAAVAAVGGTKTRFTSTERSPSHNAAVGGVSHSNHLPDAKGYAHAVDGSVYIPGRGWVPLGIALRAVASKYGLRSGDQPGFYHGGVDTVHVDDGYNQR